MLMGSRKKSTNKGEVSDSYETSRYDFEIDLKKIEKKLNTLEIGGIGLKNEQLWAHLGIGKTKFHALLKHNEEFAELVGQKKDLSDILVYSEIANKLVSLAQSGNVTAIIFYLKANGVHNWSEHNQTTIVDERPPVDLSNYSQTELKYMQSAAIRAQERSKKKQRAVKG